MTDNAVTRPTPIYASYLTFTNLLDWLHEVGTLPSQFDRSYWGHKFSGSGGGQLMAGLRFLGLLNGDVPTEHFELLARADGEERRAMIAEILREAYGAEFIDSLPKATPRLLNEHLQGLGTTDTTHDKARSFFVNAAKAVGLQMPGQIAKQARNRPAVTRKAASTRRRQGPDTGGGGKGNTETPPPPSDRHHRSGLEIHPALEPLLSDLTKIAPGWTGLQRTRWKLTWDAVLDYAYPVAEVEDGGK